MKQIGTKLANLIRDLGAGSFSVDDDGNRLETISPAAKLLEPSKVREITFPTRRGILTLAFKATI
jgi:hypothetical protein